MTSPVGEVYRYIIESDQHSLQGINRPSELGNCSRIKEVSGVADLQFRWDHYSVPG